MDAGTTERPKANGLKTALDSIVAPKEAFESLRTAPTWGWAFLITLVLYAAGSYLMTPAIVHATQANWPHMLTTSPQLAAETPAQQQAALAVTLKIVSFSWAVAIVVLPLVLLLQTVVMLVFKAIGKGDASFGTLWAVANHTALPSVGLGAVCTALIVVLRGPESFTQSIDVQTAMPSLGMLAAGAPPKLHAFLASINPFSLWGCVLIVIAMSVTARVSRPIAWSTGILMLLAGACFATFGAQ